MSTTPSKNRGTRKKQVSFAKDEDEKTFSNKQKEHRKKRTRENSQKISTSEHTQYCTYSTPVTTRQRTVNLDDAAALQTNTLNEPA